MFYKNRGRRFKKTLVSALTGSCRIKSKVRSSTSPLDSYQLQLYQDSNFLRNFCQNLHAEAREVREAQEVQKVQEAREVREAEEATEEPLEDMLDDSKYIGQRIDWL